MAKNGTVLLADGNGDDLILIKSALQDVRFGQSLVEMNNGDEAIRYLAGDGPYADRATHPLPFLIILDLKLSGKDGHAVLEWLQKHPKTSCCLTTIVLANSGLKAPMEKAYSLGANSYLIKPPNYNQLLEMMRIVKEYWIDTNCRPGFDS